MVYLILLQYVLVANGQTLTMSQNPTWCIVINCEYLLLAYLKTNVCSCFTSVCSAPSLSSTTTRINFLFLKLNFVIFGLKIQECVP